MSDDIRDGRYSDICKLDSVKFVCSTPTSLFALDLFNLTLKCLKHIVLMYVCNTNLNSEQQYTPDV